MGGFEPRWQGPPGWTRGRLCGRKTVARLAFVILKPIVQPSGPSRWGETIRHRNTLIVHYPVLWLGLTTLVAPVTNKERPTSGPVAQLGARLHGMQEVAGSSPARSTKPFWLTRFDAGGFLDLSEPLFYTEELS